VEGSKYCHRSPAGRSSLEKNHIKNSALPSDLYEGGGGAPSNRRRYLPTPQPERRPIELVVHIYRLYATKEKKLTRKILVENSKEESRYFMSVQRTAPSMEIHQGRKPVSRHPTEAQEGARQRRTHGKERREMRCSSCLYSPGDSSTKEKGTREISG